jgi:hypothetical protein
MEILIHGVEVESRIPGAFCLLWLFCLEGRAGRLTQDATRPMFMILSPAPGST